jgi:hypothetical protein
VATSVKKSKKSSKNKTLVTHNFRFRRLATKKHGIALAFILAFALIGISMLLLTRAASTTGNIKNAAGKCLNNKKGVTADTNPMQLYRCSTSASQTFTLPGDGTIRIQGKCMDVKGGILKSGSIVQIYTCKTSRVQKWTVKSNGTIVVSQAPTLCLHNKKDLNVDGNPILIANCHGTRSQKWTVPTAGGGGVTPGTWPSAPPAQICGNSVLNGGPTSAPAGAITLPAGNNSNVDLEQANKTYWFAPGTHTLGTGEFAQIQPSNNSTYIGAPGAILDGQNLNRYAFTGHATGVTIKYLKIQHFDSPSDEGVVNHNSGDNWTMSYNTVTQSHGGAMFLGTNNVATYNCLKDNGQYGFQVYNDTDDPHNVTLDHNEISGNNTDNLEYDSSGNETGCGCTGGGKFWSAHGVRVTNNYVHDNKSVGLWADTNDVDFLIQGNWIENNDSEAIFYEISYNITIVDNVIKHNALVSGGEFAGRGDDFPESAVYISESGGDSRVSSAVTGSPTVTISHNLLLDNWGGITLWENADRFCNSPANSSSGYCTAVNPTVAKISTCTSGNINNAPYKSDCRWKTQNVTISDNEFRITPANVNNCNTAYCGHMAVLSNYGTYPSWSPYKGTVIQQAITFNQNNHWTNNKYYGPWQFVAEETGSLKSWNTWRASPYNQDAGSTIQ